MTSIRPTTSDPVRGYILSFICIISLVAASKGSMGNDEGIWSYIGRIWDRNGMLPYRDAVENKTPLIFLLYAISHHFFGVTVFFVRLLSVLAVTASTHVLGRITARLSRHEEISWYAMLIFGLSMCWKVLDGDYPTSTETFMVLFQLLSLNLVLGSKPDTEKRVRSGMILAAGICAGLAISFKQIAVISALASLLILARQQRRWTAGPLILFVLGAFLSMGASLLPLLLSGGTIGQYLEGAWLILAKPTPAFNGSAVSRAHHFVEFWISSRLFLFLPLLFLFFRYRSGISIDTKRILVTLFILEFLGANLSGNAYGHQLRQVIPVLSIMAAFGLQALLNRRSPGMAQTWSILLVILLFFPYRVFFIQDAGTLRDKVPDERRALGAWLRARTRPDEPLYLVGTGGNPILSFSERISSSRYFNSIFITEDRIGSEIGQDLADHPPTFILLSTADRDAHARHFVSPFLDHRYHLVGTGIAWEIWQKNNPTGP